MIVKYTEDYKSGVYHYEVVSIAFCCDKMRDACDDEFVKFGEYDGSASQHRCNTMNIFRCSAYPEGAFWDEIPINRCPWCGAEINVVEIGSTRRKEKK